MTIKFALLFLLLAVSLMTEALACQDITPQTNYATVLSCIKQAHRDMALIKNKINQQTNSQLPVGTVIGSLLEPRIFAKKYGENWVLADGSRISINSAFYKLTERAIIPDMRGVFLRGMNLSRNDGRQDPDGDNRSVGEFQEDSFKAHDHGGGNHKHKYKALNGSDPHGPRTGTASNNNLETQYSGPIINKEGGKETRPKNVTVYYYVKIN